MEKKLREKPTEKNPSKPAHPGRDVSHNHQNADGVSAGKKLALECICPS